MVKSHPGHQLSSSPPLYLMAALSASSESNYFVLPIISCSDMYIDSSPPKVLYISYSPATSLFHMAFCFVIRIRLIQILSIWLPTTLNHYFDVANVSYCGKEMYRCSAGHGRRRHSKYQSWDWIGGKEEISVNFPESLSSLLNVYSFLFVYKILRLRRKEQDNLLLITWSNFKWSHQQKTSLSFFFSNICIPRDFNKHQKSTLTTFYNI